MGNFNFGESNLNDNYLSNSNFNFNQDNLNDNYLPNSNFNFNQDNPFMSNLADVQQENPLTISTGNSPFHVDNLSANQGIDNSSLFGSNLPSGDNTNSWWNNAMGKNGWAAPAANMLKSVGDFYTGYQQNKLAGEALDTQKQQFADQFNVQKQQVNMDIMDQGTMRYDRDPTNNLTPDEYYTQNKL